MFSSQLHIALINGNQWVDISNNINYMKVFKLSRDDLTSQVNERKYFIYSQIILIVKSLCKVKWGLKKTFKSYSKNQ
jgi:hypothetical protein